MINFLVRLIVYATSDLDSLVKEANKIIENISKNQGIVLDGYDNKKKTNAILTLKDEGIELNWKGVFTSRDKGLQEIKYSNITSIGLKKGLVLGTVEIRFPGGKIKIGQVNKNLGNLFVSNVKQRIKNLQDNQQNQSSLSPMEEIKKAKELLEIGAITEEEFDKIKKSYLKNL